MIVAFYTLGCMTNQYETDMMKSIFQNKKHKIVDFDEFADVYIINSCTVTNISDRETKKAINSCKKNNKNSITVLAGCYAEAKKNKLNDLNVDCIIGNSEKNRILEIILQYIKSKTGERVICIEDISKINKYTENENTGCNFKLRGNIKIQDGCDNFCTYCIVPYVRGRVRSKSIDDILKEAKKMADKGIKEILVSGIEIASYGKEYESDVSLINVLEALNCVEGIERIRLSSLEPRCISEEFVKRLKELKKICPQFHISLQSGCDSVLKRMNRKYSTRKYLESVNLLRDNIPNTQITTDVIVGFPGESDDEAYKTYEFVRKIEFLKVHIFKFSKRENTMAAKMNMQVDERIKVQRSNDLSTLEKSIREKLMLKEIGNTYNVLFEKYYSDTKTLEGYTENHLKIKVKGAKRLCEGVSRVEVLALENETMIGIIKK